MAKTDLGQITNFIETFYKNDVNGTMSFDINNRILYINMQFVGGISQSGSVFYVIPEKYRPTKTITRYVVGFDSALPTGLSEQSTLLRITIAQNGEMKIFGNLNYIVSPVVICSIVY